jgi:hypothetical protein
MIYLQWRKPGGGIFKVLGPSLFMYLFVLFGKKRGKKYLFFRFLWKQVDVFLLTCGD